MTILEAYGLDIGTLDFLLDNLSLREHRTKLDPTHSKWFEICRGISQGSILELLFLIHSSNIFPFS